MTRRNLPNIEIVRQHFALHPTSDAHVVWQGDPTQDAAVPDMWLRDRRYLILAHIVVRIEDAIIALRTGSWGDDAVAWHAHDRGPSIHWTAWQHALRMRYRTNGVAAHQARRVVGNGTGPAAFISTVAPAFEITPDQIAEASFDPVTGVGIGTIETEKDHA